MTPEAFCIGYFYINLSNKQIGVYADKTESYLQTNLLHRTYTNTTFFISCVIARTKLHRPFTGTFRIP